MRACALSLGAGVQSTATLLLALDGTIHRSTSSCSPTPETNQPPSTNTSPGYVRSPPSSLSSAGHLADTVNATFMPVPLYQRGGMGRRQCTYQFKLRPIRTQLRTLNRDVDLAVCISTDEVCEPKTPDSSGAATCSRYSTCGGPAPIVSDTSPSGGHGPYHVGMRVLPAQVRPGMARPTRTPPRRLGRRRRIRRSRPPVRVRPPLGTTACDRRAATRGRGPARTRVRRDVRSVISISNIAYRYPDIGYQYRIIEYEYRVIGYRRRFFWYTFCQDYPPAWRRWRRAGSPDLCAMRRADRPVRDRPPARILRDGLSGRRPTPPPSRRPAGP